VREYFVDQTVFVGGIGYNKQILDKISNLSPEESKEFWKILRSIDKKK
jgi:hypothetical protein